MISTFFFCWEPKGCVMLQWSCFFSGLTLCTSKIKSFLTIYLFPYRNLRILFFKCLWRLFYISIGFIHYYFRNIFFLNLTKINNAYWDNFTDFQNHKDCLIDALKRGWEKNKRRRKNVDTQKYHRDDAFLRFQVPQQEGWPKVFG